MAPDHDPPPAYLRRGPLSMSNPRERRLGKGGDPGVGVQWRRVIPAVIALVTLSAFAAAVWLAYEQGVRRGLQLSPPVVRAQPGPVKIPPVAAGGLDVPNQDKEVFDVLVAQEPEQRVEQLLPPPDEPLPAPEPEPAPAPAPAPEPEPEQAPVEPEPVVAPEQQLAALGPGAEAGAEGPAADLAAAPVIEVEPALVIEPEPVPVVAPWPAPAPEPAPEPVVEPEPAPEPDVIVLAPPPGLALAPGPEPAVIVLTPPPGVAPAPALEPAPEPAPAVEVADLPEPEAAILASFRIQLGSFRNRDAAMTHWASVLDRNQVVLEGLQPLVRTADLGDRGIFYRLQAGPLDSSIVAISLCDVLKVGNVDCLVISP